MKDRFVHLCDTDGCSLKPVWRDPRTPAWNDNKHPEWCDECKRREERKGVKDFRRIPGHTEP